jgi:hypothetical protein
VIVVIRGKPDTFLYNKPGRDESVKGILKDFSRFLSYINAPGLQHENQNTPVF